MIWELSRTCEKNAYNDAWQSTIDGYQNQFSDAREWRKALNRIVAAYVIKA